MGAQGCARPCDRGASRARARHQVLCDAGWVGIHFAASRRRGACPRRKISERLIKVSSKRVFLRRIVAYCAEPCRCDWSINPFRSHRDCDCAKEEPTPKGPSISLPDRELVAKSFAISPGGGGQMAVEPEDICGWRCTSETRASASIKLPSPAARWKGGGTAFYRSTQAQGTRHQAVDGGVAVHDVVGQQRSVILELHRSYAASCRARLRPDRQPPIRCRFAQHPPAEPTPTVRRLARPGRIRRAR